MGIGESYLKGLVRDFDFRAPIYHDSLKKRVGFLEEEHAGEPEIVFIDGAAKVLETPDYMLMLLVDHPEGYDELSGVEGSEVWTWEVMTERSRKEGSQWLFDLMDFNGDWLVNNYRYELTHDELDGIAERSGTDVSQEFPWSSRDVMRVEIYHILDKSSFTGVRSYDVYDLQEGDRSLGNELVERRLEDIVDQNLEVLG